MEDYLDEEKLLGFIGFMGNLMFRGLKLVGLDVALLLPSLIFGFEIFAEIFYIFLVMFILYYVAGLMTILSTGSILVVLGWRLKLVKRSVQDNE